MLVVEVYNDARFDFCGNRFHLRKLTTRAGAVRKEMGMVTLPNHSSNRQILSFLSAVGNSIDLLGSSYIINRCTKNVIFDSGGFREQRLGQFKIQPLQNSVIFSLSQW